MKLRTLLTDLLQSDAYSGPGDGCDVTDYIRHIEREFGISLSVTDVEQLYTLSDMVACVVRLRDELGLLSAEPQVWPKVRQITAYEMGVDAAELRPDTRYIEDLSC